MCPATSELEKLLQNRQTNAVEKVGDEAEETVDRRENDTALSSLDMEAKKSLRGEEPSRRREEEGGWRGRISRALERLKLAQERYLITSLTLSVNRCSCGQ